MRSLSFSGAAVRKCSIKKLLIKFCQSLLETLLKKRLQHKSISVNLAKFIKKYLPEHLQMAGSGFCTLLYASLHKSFHQAEQ